jgi:SAM-dependent methyltransferase
MKQPDYLLGVNQTELDRLRFQHGVWKGVTDKFFDRINVQRGWKCLDVGSGPGFVAMDLRERVGDQGEITALEPSEFYLHWFKNDATAKGWKNIKFLHGTAESAPLPRGYYDFIFVRWVIGFVPDPEKFLIPLFAALRPGGIIAFEDYIYEGLSLYPRGGAFEGMPDAVRAYWRSGGGDPYIAAKLPSILKRHGLRLIDFTPNVLSGGPESGAMEWAHRFFSTHIQVMVDKNVISQQQGDAMLKDWLEHRSHPETIFVSPMVFDVAGVRSK